ncbi:MAG: phytanoyl-CoA dioxygenase family protein [Rhodospirillales bacterium]|nr:phytanoyl-CoA dioxygenase family protein [Rhodospirillales bacterium]
MPKYFTPEQIDRFQEQGYSDVIRFLSPVEARAARESVERFEHEHPDEIGKLYQHPHILFRWLGDLVSHPVLLDGLEDLAGPNLLCTMTSFRQKNAGEGTYAGWHQDAFYVHYDPFYFVAIIAITDCTVENGCLYVLPGSHRGPLLPHVETPDEKNLLTRSQKITAELDLAKAVPVELAAGEAFVFHNMMVHGSPPNNSADRRIVLLMDVCPPSTRRLGSKDAATLLRGVDEFNNFELIREPKDDFGPDARSLHRFACETRVKETYKGTTRISPALR